MSEITLLGGVAIVMIIREVAIQHKDETGMRGSGRGMVRRSERNANSRSAIPSGVRRRVSANPSFTVNASPAPKQGGGGWGLGNIFGGAKKQETDADDDAGEKRKSWGFGRVGKLFGGNKEAANAVESEDRSRVSMTEIQAFDEDDDSEDGESEVDEDDDFDSGLADMNSEDEEMDNMDQFNMFDEDDDDEDEEEDDVDSLEESLVQEESGAEESEAEENEAKGNESGAEESGGDTTDDDASAAAAADDDDDDDDDDDASGDGDENENDMLVEPMSLVDEFSQFSSDAGGDTFDNDGGGDGDTHYSEDNGGDDEEADFAEGGFNSEGESVYTDSEAGGGGGQNEIAEQYVESGSDASEGVSGDGQSAFGEDPFADAFSGPVYDEAIEAEEAAQGQEVGEFDLDEELDFEADEEDRVDLDFLLQSDGEEEEDEDEDSQKKSEQMSV